MPSRRQRSRLHDEIILERIEQRILFDANPLALPAMSVELPDGALVSVDPVDAAVARVAQAPHGTNVQDVADSLAQDTRLVAPSAIYEARRLAFPGAEGFGAFAAGGRGGDVYHVTNLSDSGPGSLREGIRTANGPRTIVFDVAGNIDLQSKLTIDKPFLTLAGQTAPGQGITIRNYGTMLHNTHDVIIRYLRFRPGDSMPGEHDALSVIRSHDVMIDHVSASWAVDENLDTAGSTNVTVQWSIISEGLNDSNHSKGEHSAGALHNGGAITYHHNLFAHNLYRSPIVRQDADIVNNVIYNWIGIGTMAGWGGEGDDPLGSTRVNLQGNYYVAGNSTENLDRTYKGYPGSYLWASNNYVDVNLDGLLDGRPNNYYSGYSVRQAQRFDFPQVHVDDPRVALERVIREAGPSLNRDAVDQRIINQIISQTGSVIDSPSDVGDSLTLATAPTLPDSDRDGMPDSWEARRGLDVDDPADGPRDGNFDGYSNLEEYLSFMGSQKIDLRIDSTSVVKWNTWAQFTISTPHPYVNDNNDHWFEIDWNGDGRIDESFQGPLGMTVQHQFTDSGPQNIRVNIVDALGRQASATHTLFVEPPPAAIDFSIHGPSQVFVGDTALFQLDLPHDRFFTVGMDWNVDGVIDQTARITDGEIISHEFSRVGSTMVHFHVQDAGGTATVRGHSLVVTADEVVAPIISGPEVSRVGETVVLTVDGNQGKPVGRIQDYSIDWDGDGRSDQQLSGGAHLELSHQYGQSGDYAIHVSVGREDGSTHVVTHELRVEPSVSAVSFAIDGPDALLVDQVALFTITSSADLDGQPYQFQIDWDGDGRVDEIADGRPGTQLQHVYTSVGEKDLSIAIVDPSGERTVAKRVVEVAASVRELSIAGSPRVRVGEATAFEVSSRGQGILRGGELHGLEVDWDGDGTVDDSYDVGVSASLNHVFDQPGKFDVGFRYVVEGKGVWRVFEVTVLQRAARQPAGLTTTVDAAASTILEDFRCMPHLALATQVQWDGVLTRYRAFTDHSMSTNDEDGPSMMTPRMPHASHDDNNSDARNSHDYLCPKME